MDNSLSQDVEEYVKQAESNLKMEVRDAKKRRDSQLIVISNSSENSKRSGFGSTTISSIESSGASKSSPRVDISSTSFTQLEDIEMPSSFNSSTIGLEDMISISDESQTRIGSRHDGSIRFKKLVQVKDDSMLENWENNSLISKILNDDDSVFEKESESKPERWTSCNTSGVNTFYLCAETEKILDALESDKRGYKHGFISPPISRLTILDLSKLDDSLITETPNTKKYRSDTMEDLREVPSMSTPKNFEEVNESLSRNECRMNLNFDTKSNETFSSPKMQETSFTSKKEEEPIHFLNPRVNTTQTLAINTTFDKESNAQEAELPKLNVTYDAEAASVEPVAEDNLNRTFEVVGNGSFIIEGKCTNLMDMESEALDTVLGSATNTPSRGIRSYPDSKKLSKSTLRKRLSMLTSSCQGNLRNEKGDNQNYKLESRNALGQITKEQVLSRLRKKPNAGSLLGKNGPLKAVPLSNVVNQMKQIEDLKKRATSTPAEKLRTLQQTRLSDSNNSDEKEEGRLPSLPSFGSVSSIGTDGLNVASEEFMATPEVFRHRSKMEGPHVTSTPSVMPCSLKFEALGFGAAPTPIVAPGKDVKASGIAVNNCSYVVENPKVKSRLSFTAASKEESPNSDAIKHDVSLVEEERNDTLNEIDQNKAFGRTNNEEVKKDDQQSNTAERKEDCQIVISEKQKEDCGRLDAEVVKEICETGLINEELKILHSENVFASTAKEVEVESDGAALFEPENDHVSSIVDERVEILTSTTEVDFVANVIKPSINNLSTIKECDLDKKLEIIDSVNVIATSSAKICCQCGGAKSVTKSEDNKEMEIVRQEFLKTTDVEISGIQNLSSNANEIIEAYEEMCRHDIPNFTNEFNETKTEMKCETSVTATSSSKKLAQDTSRKVKPNFTNEFNETNTEMKCETSVTATSSSKKLAQDTSRKVIPNFTNEFNETKTEMKCETSVTATSSSKKLAQDTSRKVTTNNSSGSIKNTMKSNVRRSVSAPKLSTTEGNSLRNTTDNTKLKTHQASGRRLNTLPPKPSTPKITQTRRESLLKLKRESLPNSHPVLKSVNTGNMSLTKRRTTIQVNNSSNSQINKPASKALPPKPLPKVKTSVHARTFPEVKSLPPKPVVKSLPPKPVNKPTTLRAKSLLQPVENNQPKLNPNQIQNKAPISNVQSTINRNKTPRTQSPKVPNIRTGVQHKISPNVSSSNINTGMKSTGTRSKLSYSSSNKENNVQLNPMRKSLIGSSIRPLSTNIRLPSTSMRPLSTSIRPPSAFIRPQNATVRLTSERTFIPLPRNVK